MRMDGATGRLQPAALDTGAAKLPGLPRVQADDPVQVQRWMDRVTERLEVREGARGNQAERVVTQRELQALAGGLQHLQKQDKVLKPGEATLDLGGGMTATVAIERFTELIKRTRLYRDLIQRLDDPARFNDIPQAVRQALLTSVADEARKLGASVTRVEKIVNDRFSSLSVRIDQLTASTEQAAAGVRETAWAAAEARRAQAGKITQLEASLGNYYQDGAPGRVLLEQQMTATADKVEGLRGQYTLKVQAGKALAGFGLAAEEVDGQPSSAFIVAADKFAIVNPLTYTTGLTNTPDPAHIPFGVDANGIYLNHNVYVHGQMRVDTGGKTLIDGLRGSVALNAGGGSWSDSRARQAVWQHLGRGGSALNNNHLVIGDSVTMGTTTRHWNGYSWADPGVVINGSMLVNGSVAATKVDTRGLDIRDEWGNVIFSAGTKLDISRIQGLGAMARRDDARIGDTVKLPDGSTLSVTDFVNRLSRINSHNISAFMDGAAIGTAYIGNAAVNTLKIAGGAVTSMYMSREVGQEQFSAADTSWHTLASVYVSLPAGSSGASVIAGGNIHIADLGGGTSRYAAVAFQLLANGSAIAYSEHHMVNLLWGHVSLAGFYAGGFSGAVTLRVRVLDGNLPASATVSCRQRFVVVTGGKR